MPGYGFWIILVESCGWNPKNGTCFAGLSAAGAQKTVERPGHVLDLRTVVRLHLDAVVDGWVAECGHGQLQVQPAAWRTKMAGLGCVCPFAALPPGQAGIPQPRLATTRWFFHQRLQRACSLLESLQSDVCPARNDGSSCRPFLSVM